MVARAPSLEGLISGDALKAELRRRRSRHIEKSVPLTQEDSFLSDGWVLVRRNKNPLRIRRPKPLELQTEDEVWTLLALMGFEEMNEGRRFQLSTGAQLPPKQIDVMAVDQDTILVVECKASEERRPRSLQKDINETRGLKPGIISSLRRHFGSGMKVCFIYATRNIQWSRPDLARADDCQIFVLRDRGIDYYRQLADIIGPAARHQLQADVLKGTPVPGLRTQVSALQGRLGGKKFYQFAIEPERLLKLSYISHRANIDAEAIGTYQRILKKNRLREISQYIEDHDGVFPTNIVVNFRTRRVTLPPKTVTVAKRVLRVK